MRYSYIAFQPTSLWINYTVSFPKL